MVEQEALGLGKTDTGAPQIGRRYRQRLAGDENLRYGIIDQSHYGVVPLAPREYAWFGAPQQTTGENGCAEQWLRPELTDKVEKFCRLAPPGVALESLYLWGRGTSLEALTALSAPWCSLHCSTFS